MIKKNPKKSTLVQQLVSKKVSKSSVQNLMGVGRLEFKNKIMTTFGSLSFNCRVINPETNSKFPHFKKVEAHSFFKFTLVMN